MADRITPEQRSKNMQQVHGKNTGPEVYLRKLMFASGYRYRIHSKSIPGHPDIWLKKYNTAVFVHGCFWHRHHNCKYATTPETRKEFWTEKFERNIKRDLSVQDELRNKGIKCLIVWECTIKSMKKSDTTKETVLLQVQEFMKSESLYKEI